MVDPAEIEFFFLDDVARQRDRERAGTRGIGPRDVFVERGDIPIFETAPTNPRRRAVDDERTAGKARVAPCLGFEDRTSQGNARVTTVCAQS